MNERNQILIELSQPAMDLVENIANILDILVEEMAEDALLAYVSSIEKRLKTESKRIFSNEY